MKKKYVFLFFVLTGLLPVAHAQTLDEIINKHLTAMGGSRQISTLLTTVMTGTFTAMGTTDLINTITTKKHLVGSRINIEANGTTNYQIVTAKECWIYTPVQGDKEPRPLVPDQCKAAQVQLDLQGPFINHKEKGIKVELAGKDTVDGVMCYKLKVTSPNTNVTVYSISSQTGFIVKSITKLFQFAQLEDVVTTYGDYKKNADGYWFAYSNVTPRGTTRYETIVTNVKVDEKLFIK